MLLAFDNDMGLQLGDEGLGGLIQKECVVDERYRAYAFDAHLGGDGNAGSEIVAHADNEEVTCLGGEFQKAKMTRMNNVKIARNEDDPFRTPGQYPN